MPHPPTQTEIRAMMAEVGLRPDRRYGQHFLVDGNLMRLLVDAADLGPTDTVLEVGPGVGNLTELLIESAGWVVAVEVDPKVAAVARARLAGAENLDLVVTDILADKRTVAPEVPNFWHSGSAAWAARSSWWPTSPTLPPPHWWPNWWSSIRRPSGWSSRYRRKWRCVWPARRERTSTAR
jgi:16S rRNA (adenine1518-N6/adenine1519-N6)-dimethyltransferase